MLTSFMVKCPHSGCDWFGSLLPENTADSWCGAIPKVNKVVFQCPQCLGEWHAHVHGDDIEMLTLESASETWI